MDGCAPVYVVDPLQLVEAVELDIIELELRKELEDDEE